MHHERLQSFVEESHFSIRVTRCSCEQRFAVVFMERVDWQGGEDEQTWLAVPIHAAELATLTTYGENELPTMLTAIVRQRRFLVRSYPSAGVVEAWWRDAGFSIGPHD